MLDVRVHEKCSNDKTLDTNRTHPDTNIDLGGLGGLRSFVSYHSKRFVVRCTEFRMDAKEFRMDAKVLHKGSLTFHRGREGGAALAPVKRRGAAPLPGKRRRAVLAPGERRRAAPAPGKRRWVPRAQGTRGVSQVVIAARAPAPLRREATGNWQFRQLLAEQGHGQSPA